MAEDHGEKTQQPTPHRRQQMREAGHVAHSAELTSIGVLLAGLLGLIVAGGTLLTFLVELLAAQLSGEAWLGGLASGGEPAGRLIEQWNSLAIALSKAVLPLLGVAVLAGVALAMVQTGPMFLPSRLVPDFSRVNPLAGMTRIVSASGAVRLGFGLVRIGVIAGVAASVLYQRRGELMSAAALDVEPLAALVWDVCLWTCVKIGLALAVMAIFDYGYQWWKYERNMRMTPQELREELRHLQGDPAVASRRRAVRAQMSAQPLPAVVPRATLIIADKAIAVAVEYRGEAMRVPHFLTRGAGPAAQQIRDLAGKHGIPVVQQPALAAALFKEAETPGPIPQPHWVAVAEVLTSLRAGHAA